LIIQGDEKKKSPENLKTVGKFTRLEPIDLVFAQRFVFFPGEHEVRSPSLAGSDRAILPPR
jgi:hypothetical protein